MQMTLTQGDATSIALRFDSDRAQTALSSPKRVRVSEVDRRFARLLFSDLSATMPGTSVPPLPNRLADECVGYISCSTSTCGSIRTCVGHVPATDESSSLLPLGGPYFASGPASLDIQVPNLPCR